MRAELFGHMRVAMNGQAVDLPASKKTRGLLGYLLSSPRPLSRSELCDLLWEEAEDPRGALRWSLSKLRTTLGPETVLANRNTVELNAAAIEVDVALIDAASGNVASKTTDALVAMEMVFQGEFLNGLELSDCYGFYEWCQSERSRYGRLRAEILGTLISRHSGQPGAALEYAHKLVGMNPFEEPAHIKVIELLQLLGRSEEAAAQAAQCRKIFQLELGVEPTEALDQACQTVALLAPNQETSRENTQTKVNASGSGARSQTRFIGREAELRLIRSAFGGSGPAVALIVGAPGIGKSALLSEIGKEYGTRHLSARTIEVERSRPFGVWIDALDQSAETEVVRDIQHKLHDALLVRPDSSENLTEQQVFDGFRRILIDLSQRGPVLIALDDAQWMEPSSCALLSYLIRHLGAGQVHFCLAARAGEIDDNQAVQTLLSGLGNDVQRIALTGLSEIEASALVQGMRTSVNVQDVVRNARGNPFYLMELSRADDHGSATTSLLNALSDRIERLSPTAITFVSWASVFGRTIPMDAVIKTSGLDLPTVLETIEELENREIIRPVGDGTVEFTHDLVRDASYERLSNNRRRLMHRRVAEMLALEMVQRPEWAARVLHHSAMTDHHILAAQAAVIAGQHALKAFANSEAAELARKGLFHAEKLNAGSERINLTMALLGVHVLSASGISTRKTPELVSALQAQISHARLHLMADEVAHGEHLLSVLYQELGNLKAASMATARAAEAADRIDAQKKVRQLANSARCLLELGRDIPKAIHLCRDAELLAEQEGVTDSEIYWSQGLLAHWMGDLDSAASRMEKALDLAQKGEDRWRQCKCLIWAAMIALERDLPEAAISYANRLEDLAAKIGEGAMAPLARSFVAIAQHPNGDLDAALEALEIADDKTHLAYVLNFAAERHCANDDMDRASEFAHRAFEVADAIGSENEKAFARSVVLMVGEEPENPTSVAKLDEWASSPQFTARVHQIARSAKLHRSQMTQTKGF